MPKGLDVRDLSASIPVMAPSGFSLAFLNTYITDLGGGTADAMLPLHFKVKQLAGLVLERDVNVRVDYVPQAGGPAVLNVAWEPDASMFPRFEGRLHARDDDAKTCRLSIEGAYEAPGGMAGQIFDAVVGVRIAQATIEQLLERFRDAIEADYKRRTEYA